MFTLDSTYAIHRRLQVCSLFTARLLIIDSCSVSEKAVIQVYSPQIASMFTVDGSFANCRFVHVQYTYVFAVDCKHVHC